MSRFFSEKFKELKPYTPGEQPRDMEYIKLNTNESPFPPSEIVISAAKSAASKLNLYPDPECKLLKEAMAKRFGVLPENVILTNGSDDVLNFAFMAFTDANTPAVFADITYGFYEVFAKVNNSPYKIIPLKDDFTIDASDYCPSGGTVFIANPNAPTGIVLELSDIEKIVAANSENVVVIDEAYVDFGSDSAIRLINKYDNLLVTGTFSKSRSMAGARLGFGIASAELIKDLETLRYSTNPYNINRMSEACALASIENDEINMNNCAQIIKTREETAAALKELGFEMTESATNFLFIKHPAIPGKDFYLSLRERGILVRHFDGERISDYNRVTIGSAEEMQSFINAAKEILEQKI